MNLAAVFVALAFVVIATYTIVRMLSPGAIAHFNPSVGVTIMPRRRVGISAAADALSITMLQRLGITRVRATIIWNNYLDARTWAADRVTLDPSGKTNAQWFAVDMAAYQAAGISVLVVVHTPPAGMTLAQGIVAMPTFVATLAAAYPGRTWEILNEPNSQDSFNNAWFSASDGTVTDATRGDRYGQLISPVYTAIKAADSTATVITGGTGANVAAFYGGIVGRAPGKFDGFGIHAYGPPALTNFQLLSIAMRSAAPGLPLHCTEWGNATVDEVGQASDIGLCLDDNDRNNRYESNYLYTLISSDGYGVVRSDGSRRQAAMLLVDRPAA